MDPLTVVQQTEPRDLARVLDHRVGRAHVETHDLLEALRERAVELADLAGAHFCHFFDEGHIEPN